MNDELIEDEKYNIEKENIDYFIIKKAISILKKPHNFKLKIQTRHELELLFLLLDLQTEKDD